MSSLSSSALSMNIATLLSKEIDTRINAIMVAFSQALIAEGVDNDVIQQAWAQVSDNAVADMKTDLVKAETKAKKAKEAVEKKVEKDGKPKCSYQGPRAKKPCGKLATEEHNDSHYCKDCFARVTKPTCGYILGSKCKDAGKICGKACQITEPFGFSVVIEGRDYEGVYLCNQHGKSVQGAHEKQNKPKCTHVTKNGNQCKSNAGPDGVKCSKHDGSKKAASKSDNKAVIAKALNQEETVEEQSNEASEVEEEPTVQIEIVDEEQETPGDDEGVSYSSSSSSAVSTPAPKKSGTKPAKSGSKADKAEKTTNAAAKPVKTAEDEEKKENKTKATKAKTNKGDKTADKADKPAKSSTKSERKAKKEVVQQAADEEIDELDL